MMMIIGGIFVEIRTPGVGVPLMTALVGAVLYFAPAYLGHQAEHWEILLFAVGLILIAMEVFVIPGFGVCGVGGILLVIASLALAMVDNEIFREFDGAWNLRPIIKPLAIVTGSAAVALFGSMWLVSKLYATRSFDHIALRQAMNADEGFTGVVSGLESLVGCEVTVFTDMSPGGKVKTEDGHIFEATLKFGGYASKGEKLRVLSAEQGRLYCEKL
jgi:membrane-bound serine protease (ClpP class)